MKYIVEAFGVMLVLIMNLLLCVGVVSVSADVAAAREYKADVIAEVENSNFNPVVMEKCKEQAELQGYELAITTATYDPVYDRCIAEVELTYTYEIPVLGISEQRVTRGIAR